MNKKEYYGNMIVLITKYDRIEVGSNEMSLGHTFYLFYGFTNLLGFRPFRRPAPKPLILLLPKAPTVSVLPVRILSLAITNSRQLSLFNCYFLVFSMKTGEAKGEILSTSSSIYSSDLIGSGSPYTSSSLK